MTIKDNSSRHTSSQTFATRSGERGAALAAALLMLGLLSAVAMTVLAVVTTETRIAGSDLKRTQTFYAAAAGIEKMTSDYSALFQQSARPTEAQINAIAYDHPQELDVEEGFNFDQVIVKDVDVLASMQATQGITDPNKLPIVTLPADSAFNGLIASVKPYLVKSRATSRSDGTSVSLTRTMNNYLIPLFQFGMFSDNDIELHPGPAFTFNGRVHANGNIYVNGNVKFLDKVTTANEFIYDVLRNGSTRTGANVSMQVGSVNVSVTKGSMTNGPNLTTATASPAGQRGYFPGSPDGTINSTWSTSVAPAASGTPNRFGGQLLTRTTGASPLKLPLQLDNNPTRELIKRRMPNDSPDPAYPTPLSDARYHSKAGIRILIDDEGVTNDAAGLYAVQNGDGVNSHDGVNLSSFDPIPLPNSDALSGGGRALWRVPGPGTAYTETILTCPFQQNGALSTQALTVRGVKPTLMTNVTPTGSTVAIPKIPAGAGLRGHILIQIADANGVWRDVTREILSMGMTVGEPNAIVHLQRPLWTAFTQGSRDASGGSNQNLVDILNNTVRAVDGEIQTSPAPTVDGTYGYLTGIADDLGILDLSVAHPIRAEVTPSLVISDWGTTAWNTSKRWNAIVPINVYNVREGHLKTSVTQNAVYERGITNVIELNMRNLARWMDGVYDQNLLAGTTAVSSNIAKPDGYIVYISDRRGDKVKSMVDLSGATINSTNGMVDNLDIYGPNGTMDPGEDVRNTGLAVGSSLGSPTITPFFKDTTELPDPVNLTGTSGGSTSARIQRALSVAAWSNPSNFLRHSVRLFNGENLQVTGAAGKLSTTLGITVAAENMVYVWGNYNTTGINQAPGSGLASLNDPTASSRYTGNQVPASIVGDAIFPLSKTWFDSSSALYPDDYEKRPADRGAAVTSETSVRAGIIAGNNLSALDGTPDADNDDDSRLSGGMHNFPRFLEDWLSDDKRWNFAGSFVPLYYSTQALGPWWYVTDDVSIYGAPVRNWAYDTTFLELDRLPPGTPMFQHVEPTGFRQVL